MSSKKYIIGYCLIAIVFLSLLGTLLFYVNSGRLNPHSINVPKQVEVPTFAGEKLGDLEAFNDTDLKASSKPILVSFFSSWCVPCVEEMYALRKLSKVINIWGISYQDQQEKALAFLNRDGSPFSKVIRDASGNIGIEWHVTGVPENFLVFQNKIIWHGTGTLIPEQVTSLLKQLPEGL